MWSGHCKEVQVVTLIMKALERSCKHDTDTSIKVNNPLLINTSTGKKREIKSGNSQASVIYSKIDI